MVEEQISIVVTAIMQVSLFFVNLIYSLTFVNKFSQNKVSNSIILSGKNKNAFLTHRKMPTC